MAPSLAVLALAMAGLAQSAPPQEVVAEIRIHGNVATPDDEVLELAGIQVGAPLAPTTVADIAARLRDAKRFQRVDVLKRFASISDPTQIALVIIVDEGPVKIEMTGDPDRPTRVVRRRLNLLFLPVLNAEDGYGVTYGVRAAVADPAGKGSRLSFPLTWGGDKRAAAEFDKDLDAGPLDRLQVGASISRRTHPFFRRDEDRDRVWVRGEREVFDGLRAGATGGWQRVSFLDRDDRFAHAGADLVLDTRQDPTLARNAVYARAAWDHLNVQSGGAIDRLELEGRGYIGLIGQNVLVVRALRSDADRPLPAYLQPILGGLSNLRGFKAGTAVGDTLVAGSAELRVPLTSPLRIAKIGVSAFVDAGAVYDEGARLEDQSIRKGYGGSLWLSAAFLRLNVAVAHGVGASTRAHIGGSLSF